MRFILYFSFIAFLGVLTTSCTLDNYDAPNVSFKGRIVYKGEPIYVEADQVRFQLWQPGWGKLAPIDVAISQEGNYSAMLFSGKYKMIFPKGEGPFMTNIINEVQKDTVYLDVVSNSNTDVEVKPYFMLRNVSFSKGNNAVNAACGIEKIITDVNAKSIERVYLFINKTQFVSRANNIKSVDMAGSAITDVSKISLSVDVPNMSPTQNYVYARIGLKISGVEDMIFSAVQKVDYK